MRLKTLLLVAAASVVAPGLYVPTAFAEAPQGTRGPRLEGPRRETLRALARHLDQTARGALEGAMDDAQHGTVADARFLSSIRSFGQRVQDFRATVEDDRSSAVEVAAKVDALAILARQANDGIRSARTLESTYDDWDSIVDVLERMRRLLAGEDVEVPVDHVVAALSGSSLQEFRQLAHDLDLSATRAHLRAKQDLGDFPDRGRQFLGELEYFAVQGHDLHGRADAGRVDPQQIGPIVDHVLEDARQADRRMRDAHVFTSIWDDSGRTITILQRMAGLVRSCLACDRPLAAAEPHD